MFHRLSVEVLKQWSVDSVITVHQFVDRSTVNGQPSYSRLLEVCHECLCRYTARFNDVFHQRSTMSETDVEINFDDFVIGDLSVIVVAQDGIPDHSVEHKYLVELVAQQVGLFAVYDGLFKVMLSKLVLHEWQVVVEVTTNDDSRQLVLSDDITDDIRYPLRSLLLIGLLSSFEIARDQMYPARVISELHLCPVHV